MKLYHRTTEGYASAIMADGFRDGTSCAGRRGVWLTKDAPLDDIWAAGCPAVIEVDLPDDVGAGFFFPVQPGAPRRSPLDWHLLPAAELNMYPRRRVDAAWRWQEAAFADVVQKSRAFGLGGAALDTILAFAAKSRRRGSPGGPEAP